MSFLISDELQQYIFIFCSFRQHLELPFHYECLTKYYLKYRNCPRQNNSCFTPTTMMSTTTRDFLGVENLTVMKVWMLIFLIFIFGLVVKCSCGLCIDQAKPQSELRLFVNVILILMLPKECQNYIYKAYIFLWILITCTFIFNII